MLFCIFDLASAVQEALTRICNGTAHYSAARTLNTSEQPLFAAAAKAQCDLVVPYAVSCYQRIYPQASAPMEMGQATKALREVIQAWDQKLAEKTGAIHCPCCCSVCQKVYLSLSAVHSCS